MEKGTYVYSYSAERSREIEKIREKYLPHEESRIERLRRLDRKAQTAGVIESLALGIVGSLIFGVGMCFGLDVFGGSEWLTLLFGGLGTLVMLPAYPIYKFMQKRAREKLAPEILSLTDELIAEGYRDEKK